MKIMLFAAFGLFLGFFSVAMQAQTELDAPVPAQFATAKTAFLAYAGAPAGSRITPAMVYPSAFRALNKMGNYSLSATPENADLLMEVSVGVQYSSVSSGSSTQTPYVRLVLYDRKTHALLWEIDEMLGAAFREASMQKNIDQSMAALAADLKALAMGKLP